MAISKQFGGTTILKPGGYSVQQVANTAGSDLGAADVLFLVGESSKGAPGAVSGIMAFPVQALSSLVSTYGSGPLVDCAIAAARPSLQNGIGGPSTILVWKTNASLQASAYLTQSASNIYQIKDLGWGTPGNNLSVIVATGDSAKQKTISIAQLGGTVENLGENPAQAVLTVHYTGNGSAATLSIAGSTDHGKMLTTSLTGQTDSSVNLSIALSAYNMNTLAQYINAQPGYSASLSTVSLAVKPATDLDLASALDIKGSTQTLYRLTHEILDLLNTSQRIEAILVDPPVSGLLDNTSGVFLTGGAQGASANSDFANGMQAALAEDLNVMLTCVSRDASEDIADPVQGFTDASSTYTIAAVLAAQASALQVRASVQNRKEAGGFGGVRKSTKAAAYAAIAAVGSAYMQVCMQDCLMLDQNANQSYKHPHVLAAFAAGMRTGQAVGEPLTFKFPQILQAGHFINPATGLSTGDFNPSVDFNTAIQNGVLFVEKASGGFRWVVDNTTYGIDQSFVYNRGSVMYATFYVNKQLRGVAENFFIGKKVSNGAASSLKNAIAAELKALNAPDVNIVTSSPSQNAPDGFKKDTFVVTIIGNTALVQVEYLPVQGLDFVFYEFTLGDIQQSA
jgi:hypothetical protein